MHDHRIVDLFAGPGGLDVGARWLNLSVVGVELDDDACETRRAAGLETRQGDVRSFGPGDFPKSNVLAGGPPCQTYAVAGGGAGRRALTQVLELADLIANRRDQLAEVQLTMLAKTPGDKGRTGLVLQPLRWALAAIDAERPYDAIVLEQVPTVLPVWVEFGEILRHEGYSVVHEVLRAEEYGLPQTRRRAVLIARLNGEASMPEKTHRPFHGKLTPEEEKRRKWVAMRDVLDRKGGFEVVSNYGTGGDPKVRGRRQHDEPAFTVTGKVRRNKVESTPDGRESRFSDAEAGQLQSFPEAYPWQGKDIPQQIGNAMPPLLAVHVLTAALGLGNEARDGAVEKAIADRAAAAESRPSDRSGETVDAGDRKRCNSAPLERVASMA